MDWIFDRSRPVRAAALCLLATLPLTSMAELPKELEPEYAEAVLAFNGREYDRALKLLDELLKQKPGASELLELKALTLKSTKRTQESAEIYSRLISAKTAEKAHPKEIAPYHFELGVIRFREKNYSESSKHLEISVEEGFNEGAASFFLGVMKFQGGNWSEADRHFRRVTSSSADELIPPSHFYLGQTSLKTGYSPGGVRHLIYARESADELLNREDLSPDTRVVAERIKAQAEKALAPLDKSRTYANVAVLGGYDSNTLAFPDDFEGAIEGKATAQTVIRGSVGWMSSPISTYQLHPSLRTEYNFNTNPAAFGAMFSRTTPAFYLTRTPMARLSIGAKVETPVAFRYNDSEDSRGFELFSAGIELGPFVRWEVFQRTYLSFEYFRGMIRYPGDKLVAANQWRSGGTERARISIMSDRGHRFLNPSFSLGIGSRGPDGETDWQDGGREFSAEYENASISNSFYIGDNRIVLSLNREWTEYNRRHGPRRADRTDMIGAMYSRKLTKNLTFLAQVAWTKNYVSPADDASRFSFTRFISSAGVSYSLF